MFYDEKLCDGCSKIMHEDDDIVVCPECGTPQHRECYNKNKRCVNGHLHAEGFDWRTANAEPEPAPDAQSQDNNRPIKIEVLNAEEQSEMVGGMSDLPLPGISIAPVLTDGQGLKSEDEFDGIKVSEALTYTQISAGRYLKKFYKNRGKKHLFSWNWAAFIFSPAWFFFRKIYNLGALFLALTVACALVATPFAETINENYDSYEEKYTAYYEAKLAFAENSNDETQSAYTKASEAFYAKTVELFPSVAVYSALTFLIPNTIAALIADGGYRRKMLEDIAIAKRATQDEKILKYSLLRRGGVSMFAGLAALFAELNLPSIIMSIVSNFI